MEIPVIDYVTNMELPNSFPNTISTTPLPSHFLSFSNSQTYIFFKWGALILALVASFTTLIKTAKILILSKYQQYYSLQQPLLVQEFSDYDSDTDMDSESDSDGEHEPSSASCSNSSSVSDTEEDDRGEGFENCFGLRRRRNGSVLDLTGLFTTGKNVVKLWDSVADNGTNVLSSLFSPGNVVVSAERNLSGRFLRVRDTRVNNGWAPRVGRVKVNDSGAVVLRDDDVTGVSVVQSLQRKSDADSVELIDKSTDLVEHFNSFVDVSSDSTPCTSIISLLLQSLQRIPSVTESRSRRLIPLFFKFLGYTDGLFRLGSYNREACKGNEMQSILKEWLGLVKLMRNPKALYQSQFLKDVLQFRLIDDNDPEIQVKALESLFPWKDEYLLPYEQNLRNLINSKRLREELTTWSLSMESGFIEEAHRGSLVPLVLRILMPKVRKLKTLAARKHASVNLRKAVLRFISEVDVKEVPLFMALLVKHLIVPNESDGTGDRLWVMAESSFNEFHSVQILEYFTLEKIKALSLEKLYGFVHVIEEVIATFREVHIKPFLDLLMGIVVRMLQGCCSRLEAAQDLSSCSDVKQLKDLRSLCLRIISSVLHKYDDNEFSYEFWELFFISVKPLVDNLKQHGSSSEKPSALFSCFLAMSKSYYLVQLLSRVKNLVPDILAILTVSTASEAIVLYVLKFIENLLTLDEMGALDGENAVRSVIVGNLNEVTSSLHSLLQRHIGNSRKAVKSTGDTHVKIFKLLSKYIKDPLLAGKFVEVLLPFLDARTKNSDRCLC